MVMIQALKLNSVENGYVKNSNDIGDSKFCEVLNKNIVKVNPKWVENFITDNEIRMNKLSIKEARKYLYT